MSGFFRVQVTIDGNSGLPEDVIVNTWHFDSDQTFAEDADDVAGRVQAFYEAIDQYMPANTIGPNATIKVYDMADPEPRIPGHERVFALTPGAGVALPQEIALCLSMEGAVESGANMRRRRGRVFLGPWSNANLDQGFALKGPIWSAAFRDIILDAALTLATGPDPGDGRLAIYSPTAHAAAGGGAANLDAAFTDVVTLWADDAVDIVRKRGPRPSSRITRTVV